MVVNLNDFDSEKRGSREKFNKNSPCSIDILELTQEIDLQISSRETPHIKNKLITLDQLFPFCIISPTSRFEGPYVSPASIMISIQGEVHDFLVFFRPHKGKFVVTCPSPQFLDIFLEHFIKFPFSEIFCRQTSYSPFDLVITPISMVEATNLGNVDLRWSIYLAQSRGGFPNPFLVDLGKREQGWAAVLRNFIDSKFAFLHSPFYLTPYILEPIAWALRFETFWKALNDCLTTYRSEVHGINVVRINSSYCDPSSFVKEDISSSNKEILQRNAEIHLAKTRQLLVQGLDCFVNYYTNNWICESFWKTMDLINELGYKHKSPQCQTVRFHHTLSRFDKFSKTWEV